jgi:NAD(P)-dependent dehydrogenase (short-subunit alcohol dehydrogenase family)
MPALAGLQAIVTGGGRGIGRAIAEMFAAEGASVAVFARSAGELRHTVATIERTGGTARAFTVDVTDARAVRDAIDAVGAADILVNNAGTIGPFGPTWTIDPDEWWQSMDVNVRGPLLTMHAVLPGMIERRRGRVINVVTGMAPMAYYSSYLTSKTALVRATECVALEAKPYGVTAFSMAPGTVRTAMTEHSLNSDVGRKWLPWFRRIFDEGLDVPVERPARLAVTLASGKADALSGRYLTPHDDLDLLLSSIAEIQRDYLYWLRVPTHPRAKPSPITAIRDAAAKALDA